MLEWEWPAVWDPAVVESVREDIQQRIRHAMTKSKKAQIRGSVVVEDLQLGTTPPELSLSSIRELSASHTALMVKLRYSGDAAVTLKGLEINLDTVASTTDEADSNLSLPFFCPFEMKLCDIVIDGIISIEIFQELEANPLYVGKPILPADVLAHPRPWPPPHATASAGGAPHASLSSLPHDLGSLRSLRSNASVGCVNRAGYGVLVGVGGRGRIRPPDAQELADGGVAVVDRTFDAPNRSMAGNYAASGPSPHQAASARTVPGSGPADAITFVDVASKKYVVKRRYMKAQFFEDPLKSFSVISNFSSVHGANKKIEGTLKMLLRPTIESLMTKGVEIPLPPAAKNAS